MEDVSSRKSKDCQIYVISVGFSPRAHHYKMNGKERPLTSRQLTKERSSVKMNGDPCFSGFKEDFMHIAQHTLVQKPVLGTGVGFQRPSCDCYTGSSISVMLPGSMSMTSSFSSHAPPLQFTLSIILLQVIGAPLSWKKLEYDSSIEWNGWSIQPALMTAQLPQFKHEKINALIDALLQIPCRKNLEKIIGILLWATSLVHHVRFLLTSLYRDLYSIPATNYSIPPTQWEYFLRLLNDSATITVKNSLHLPLEARVVEFRHSPITAKDQLPTDLPIDRHVWVRIRDPNCDKRQLSSLSIDTLQWSKKSLMPLLSSIPLNRATSLTVNAATDAFADENEMGIGGWISIDSSIFWFSQKWNKVDLEKFLPISKCLQRYITSWEALAQLCIILMVHSKCTYRPGIINIQSGSDNTGAEANINHGFSTTEILSDIIKLVSIKQIQFNTLLNVHHIPGEKNIKADDLSRGRLSTFPESMRVLFQLGDIFDATPFPRYINPQVQWDLDIHPLAKLCYC